MPKRQIKENQSVLDPMAALLMMHRAITPTDKTSLKNRKFYEIVEGRGHLVAQVCSHYFLLFFFLLSSSSSSF